MKSKPPGTFLIRDSQGFPGSYGLAVKVETLPVGIQAKNGADPNAELVRHYLIERTPTGHVRLKGCQNEPDFGMKEKLILLFKRFFSREHLTMSILKAHQIIFTLQCHDIVY